MLTRLRTALSPYFNHVSPSAEISPPALTYSPCPSLSALLIPLTSTAPPPLLNEHIHHPPSPATSLFALSPLYLCLVLFSPNRTPPRPPPTVALPPPPLYSFLSRLASHPPAVPLGFPLLPSCAGSSRAGPQGERFGGAESNVGGEYECWWIGDGEMEEGEGRGRRTTGALCKVGSEGW